MVPSGILTQTPVRTLLMLIDLPVSPSEVRGAAAPAAWHAGATAMATRCAPVVSADRGCEQQASHLRAEILTCVTSRVRCHSGSLCVDCNFFAMLKLICSRAITMAWRPKTQSNSCGVIGSLSWDRHASRRNLNQGWKSARQLPVSRKDECAAAVCRPSLRTWCSQVRILLLIPASSPLVP
jgi:hypothetical protein